jgi:hypothetical protein
MTKSNERWWAVAGPVFAVLFWAAVFVLEPSTPGEKASAQAVVDYFNGHKGRTIADVFLGPLLVALLLVFVAYLCAVVRSSERSLTSRMAPLVLIMGTAIWASGALLGSVASLTLVSASDNGQIEIAHTVNVLSNDMWIPFIAGIAATLIGAGLTVLSSDVLPKWMGWIALVAGIISLAGPGGFLGFFVGPLWILVAGVLLFLRPQGDVSVPRARTDREATAGERTTPTATAP